MTLQHDIDEIINGTTWDAMCDGIAHTPIDAAPDAGAVARTDMVLGLVQTIADQAVHIVDSALRADIIDELHAAIELFGGAR